jgi:predicted O-methyltransferase YrrM
MTYDKNRENLSSVMGFENRRLIVQVYEEFEFLLHYLSVLKPHNILEIGWGAGGTFYLLDQISTGKKVSISLPDDHKHGLGLEQYKDRDDTFFIDGDSKDNIIFNKVQSICNQFDFIFIDGDHTYNGVKTDFNLYKQLLSPRGIIAFHDVDPNHVCPGDNNNNVIRFWHELNEGTKVSVLCTKGSGKHQPTDSPSHGFGGIGIWQQQ